MAYEITGKLIEKQSIQQLSDKFRKLEFIIEYKEKSDSQFTETIKFQLVNDKCALIDNVKNGAEIKVHFNIKGRKWEKDGKVSYFNSLEAWKIESLQAEPSISVYADAVVIQQPAAIPPTPTEPSNDLPF